MTNHDWLKRAVLTLTDECIIWPHAKNRDGYGNVWVGGKKRLAHRVALDLTKPRPIGKVCSVKGEWVEGHRLDAAHGPCHNRPCCNPRHLTWATRAENLADRKRDGTDVYVSNEAHGMCELSDADVGRIRSLYEGRGRGPTQTELADQFDCSQTQISDIVNGKSRAQL